MQVSLGVNLSWPRRRWARMCLKDRMGRVWLCSCQTGKRDLRRLVGPIRSGCGSMSVGLTGAVNRFRRGTAILRVFKYGERRVGSSKAGRIGNRSPWSMHAGLHQNPLFIFKLLYLNNNKLVCLEI
jgi:hypothetical protein